MRILICCNIYPPHFIGGAELVAHYQGKHLVAAGHQVQVFTGDTQVGALRHALRTERYDGLIVHRVHLTGEDYPSDFVNFSHPLVESHFSNTLSSFQPDVVHCHNIIGLSVTILQIAHEFGAKVVLTLHDHWAFCYKNTIMKQVGVACTDYARCEECMPFIEDGCNRKIPMRMRQDYMKCAMGAVDAFISPSQYLADTYIQAGFPPSKMQILWNGIDVDKFAEIERIPKADKLRFSFFGYFGRHKGIHTLLEALTLLKNKGNVQINLVGDGDQRTAYEHQLRENGCIDLVRFWGKIDNKDVAQAYAQTDVLVLPSIWRENQPVSITEAMACGIPVIGSNMGGIPELVEDGVTGLIFEAGNSVDLAQKMDRLIADNALVKALGVTGQSKIRLNSFSRQVDKLLEIYGAPYEIGRSDAATTAIVACFGQQVDTVCAEAMALLPAYLNGAQPYILMADWLTTPQLQRASVVWAIDAFASAQGTTELAGRGLPLLVPAWHPQLVADCRDHKCGLYFQDADEAAASIAYLLIHPNDAAVLAGNAKTGVLGQ